MDTNTIPFKPRFVMQYLDYSLGELTVDTITGPFKPGIGLNHLDDALGFIFISISPPLSLGFDR